MAGNPIPGKLPKNNAFTELLTMSIVALALFVVLFMLGLFTRQALLIVIHITLLVNAAMCMAAYWSQSAVMLWMTGISVFICMIFEWIAGVLKLATILFFCFMHNGCLEVFIPYAISAGFSFFVGFFMLVWFLDINRAWSRLRAWNKFRQEQAKKRKPVQISEDDMLDMIFYDLTGMEPIPINELALEREYELKQTKKSIVDMAKDWFTNNKYRQKMHFY